MREIRCSGLARVMQCGGFLQFTEFPPEEDSAPAMEGTAAGEMLAHYLTKPNQALGTHASNGVPFDDDMRFFTKPLVEDIRARAASEILCETRIDWQTRCGQVIRGQYDISYINRGGELCIDDLKYGWGLVEVENNWQLLGYAIGEVLRRDIAFPYINMRILQPRPHHEDGDKREWRISYEELLGYKEQIETKIAAIAAGDHRLVTGDKCKYCPAAAERCPALNKMFFRGIDMIHQFRQDTVNDAELAFQLDLIGRIKDVVDIKLRSLKDLAVSRMKEGRIIPNYVSEPSYSDRQWKSGVSPETIKTLTGRDITEQVMLSPAKAEKLGIPKTVINALVDRRFLQQKLVRKDASDLGNKIFGGVAPT